MGAFCGSADSKGFSDWRLVIRDWRLVDRDPRCVTCGPRLTISGGWIEVEGGKVLYVTVHTPRCFLQEWQAKDLCLTWPVRVANTGLKVAGFSKSCGAPVRVAVKGLSGTREKILGQMPGVGEG